MKMRTSVVAIAGALFVLQFVAAGLALAHKRNHHHRHHHHHHHGRAVAKGVAVGVTTGLVINAANKSSKCREFASRCNRGLIEYCISYETQCW